MAKKLATESLLADDGYGNLVSIRSPYGTLIKVYARVDGQLTTYEVDTADHVEAIREVRWEIRPSGYSPVLAVIDGGAL